MSNWASYRDPSKTKRIKPLFDRLLKDRVMDIVSRFPDGISTQDIADALVADGDDYTARRTVWRTLDYLQDRHMVTCHKQVINSRRQVIWKKVCDAVREQTVAEQQQEEEEWTPRPYINPIRARALGLSQNRTPATSVNAMHSASRPVFHGEQR